MSKSTASPPVGDETFATAAEWWLRLQDDPARGESRDFLDWFAVPENRIALETVKSTMAVLHNEGSTQRLVKMRTAALLRLDRLDAGRWYLRRNVLIGGAAAAAAVAIAVFKAGDSGVLNYSTATSERRDVKLPDGTKVTLDANSEISVTFTGDTRSVSLIRGRARFDVAHEVNRPFQVTSRGQTVVAIGTAFNVEQLTKEVVITLLEGTVLVRNDSVGEKKEKAGHSLISLKPGEQMIATVKGDPTVRTINLQTETAWEEGRLIFRGRPLSDAVEQINRYTNRQLRVDPSVAAIPISGVFNAGDISAFVTAVTAYFPISASMEGDGTIILTRHS